MSIFGGQYGSFGGGYQTSQGGNLGQSMQFGGGFIQGPSTTPPAAGAEVVYAMDPTTLKPRDRSGRKKPYDRKGSGWPFEGNQGGVHRQKRY